MTEPTADDDETCAVCGNSDCGTLMVNDTDEARVEHEPPYLPESAVKQEVLS